MDSILKSKLNPVTEDQNKKKGKIPVTVFFDERTFCLYFIWPSKGRALHFQNRHFISTLHH